jgi:hypothetical protein
VLFLLWKQDNRPAGAPGAGDQGAAEEHHIADNRHRPLEGMEADEIKKSLMAPEVIKLKPQASPLKSLARGLFVHGFDD